MSTEITPSTPAPASSEIADLRNQVYILLVALFVISGTVTVYMFDQARTVRKELSSAQQVITAYKQNEKTIQDFVNNLGVYGQTHPDFAQILGKYGLVPNKPGAAPAPAPAKR